MNRKVLIIDDDANLLAGCRRQLRKFCEVHTAQGGMAGLRAIETTGPFQVLVSDFRMPGMDGITFLKQAREIDDGAIHIMLSGQADMDAMIEVINSGTLFRFLTKPCRTGLLAEAIEAGFEQHRLVKSEEELLEKTLNGSIQMLIEVLSITNPIAFNRSLRLKKAAVAMGKRLKVEKLWQLEIAANLSQVGFVSVPNEIVQMGLKGGRLLAREEQMFWEYVKHGSHLVANIPRLEEVAHTIAYIEKHFNGGGYPDDSVVGEAIPLHSRILKAVSDYDMLKLRGFAKKQIEAQLQEWRERYDPNIFNLMLEVMGLSVQLQWIEKKVSAVELEKGMILKQNLKTNRGVLLVPAGVELTALMITRLRNFVANGAVSEPFLVKMEAPAES